MKKLGVVLVLVVLILITSLAWWQNGISAVNSKDKTQDVFVVGKGESVREMANRLKKEGFIKDPIAFFLLVRFKLNLDNKIQAGDHRVSPSMTASEIAKSLTSATNDVWVTIPEGYRAQEIADTLKNDLKSFDNTWRKKLEENEGYLFPDTYLIPKDAGISQVISILRNNFDEKYKTLPTGNVKLSKEEIVTIASLIEREAKNDEDRFLVSSVIQNRLKIGMKLDIDATVQYVLGYQEAQKRWWKKGLTNEDLKIDSPYNTYTNPGLPPAPISNPGLKSLDAAIIPAKTNYIFYFTDKNGVNHYAATNEEQNANINKYGL